MQILDNIKQGVVYNYNGEKIAICPCGHSENASHYWEQPTMHNHKCTKCGNTDFYSIVSGSKENVINKSVSTLLNVVHKDDSSFVVEKVSLYAHINREKRTLTYKTKDVYKLDYSFKNLNNPIKLYKNDEALEVSEQSIMASFRNIKDEDLLNAISTPRNLALYSMAHTKLGMWYYEQSHKLSRALFRLTKYPALQILSMCGFNEQALRICYSDLSMRESKETLPHKILDLPKYFLPFLKDGNINFHHNGDTLRRLHDHFGGNLTKSILQIFYEESQLSTIVNIADELIMLNTQFGYKDMLRLSTYLTREVKLEQGIMRSSDAMDLLKDYVGMSKALGHEYERYPKSLKKVHDIAVMNYNVLGDKQKEATFQSVINEEDYKRLAYSDKTYAIIIPQHVRDIIKEGDSLSHCVASYVDEVIKGYCKIVFLRIKDNPENSLVTIEIRDNKIRQIRGKFNRSPYQAEIAFTKKWINNKKLGVNCDILK